MSHYFHHTLGGRHSNFIDYLPINCHLFDINFWVDVPAFRSYFVYHDQTFVSIHPTFSVFPLLLLPSLHFSPSPFISPFSPFPSFLLFLQVAPPMPSVSFFVSVLLLLLHSFSVVSSSSSSSPSISPPISICLSL